MPEVPASLDSHAPGSPAPDSLAGIATQRGMTLASVTDLVQHAPAGWVGAASTTELVDDLQLIAPGLEPAAIRVRVKESPDLAWELSVVAHDRPGLLATSCRVLADHGLTIHAARVASWIDRGLALQRFVVAPVVVPLSGEPDWPPITLALRSALLAEPSGTGSVQELPAGGSIERLDALSGGRTSVRFRAPDAPGLLADLTSFLSGLGADVESAIVRSEGSDGVDDFVLAFADPSGLQRLEALAAH